jgi:hypothetical protein
MLGEKINGEKFDAERVAGEKVEKNWDKNICTLQMMEKV